jgi:hypothetical protein
MLSIVMTQAKIMKKTSIHLALKVGSRIIKTYKVDTWDEAFELARAIVTDPDSPPDGPTE